MTNPAEGYLIPGEVTQGNCYKVFLNDRLYAVVRNELHAELLCDWVKSYCTSALVKTTYQLAFIEGIGF